MKDSEGIRRAASLAAQGRLRVDPNPPVGCVLVRRGRVVSEGWHRYWGGPHAEVEAIRAAGQLARGATSYLTLEPCAHKGKTPPCADALIDAGVAKVVYAHADPNPKTAGKGPARLQEAGVEVRKVRSPAAVRELLRPYVEHLKRRRPWIIAKWAMTLDGRIATRTGDSGWITSPAARQWAHRNFRGRVDAILAGSGTVRVDDPALSNRSGRGRQPLRIVVCGRRPLHPRARILNDGGPTLVVAPDQFRWPKKAETLSCGRASRVELSRMMRKLHDRGIHRILVEGGGELLGSLFDLGLVDQVLVFVAPKIVGGISAVPAVAGRGKSAMDEALRLERAHHRLIGPDHVIEGYLR
ncbi:MAG: bifunctional diaminohydroxyphosphoribosylaminopyrimidine deaminase/5-amino-6-(5-phosphoribosylamino)uracil reductase RibD [Planctomycetota bacterium]